MLPIAKSKSGVKLQYNKYARLAVRQEQKKYYS